MSKAFQKCSLSKKNVNRARFKGVAFAPFAFDSR